MAWKREEIFRIILWTFVIKTKNWTLIHSILGQFQGQFSSLSLCLFYSNKWQLLSFLLDRPSFFTYTLQIHCLGLLGLNPILFWVQPKFGPYNWINNIFTYHFVGTVDCQRWQFNVVSLSNFLTMAPLIKFDFFEVLRVKWLFCYLTSFTVNALICIQREMGCQFQGPNPLNNIYFHYFAITIVITISIIVSHKVVILAWLTKCQTSLLLRI